MKKILVLFSLVFAGFYSCTLTEANDSLISERTRIELNNLDDLYTFLTYRNNRFPLVSAHRGGAKAGFPENAIETFAENAENQPMIIEFDVAMTRDSVLVLMHDDRLDRTTTGKGLVSEYSYADIKNLHLKDNFGQKTEFRIPTLAQALKWGKGKVLFTIDVKSGVPYRMVIDEVRKQHAQPYSAIITYNATQAAMVYKEAPELMISASVRQLDDLLRLGDYGVPDNRIIAFVGVSEPEQELYDRLHEHGILCILGTIGNLDKRAEVRGDELYYELVERGADFIATDRHEEAGVLLERFRKDYRAESKYVKN